MLLLLPKANGHRPPLQQRCQYAAARRCSNSDSVPYECEETGGQYEHCGAVSSAFRRQRTPKSFAFGRNRKGVRRRLSDDPPLVLYPGFGPYPSPIRQRCSGVGGQVGCICVWVLITPERLLLLAFLVSPFPTFGFYFVMLFTATVAPVIRFICPFNNRRPGCPLAACGALPAIRQTCRFGCLATSALSVRRGGCFRFWPICQPDLRLIS